MRIILGTLLNGIVLSANPGTDFKIIALVYEFILSMQLFDFLAWKDSSCGKLNQFATKGAFIQNMLQPVAVMLLLLYFTESKDMGKKGLVNLALIVYIGYIFYKLYYNTTPKSITCLRPTEKCKHLQYDWWKNIGDYPIFIYLIPIVLSFILLLGSAKFAVVHSVYFLSSFLISGKFYACGLPSMFCLFATGGPLLNLLLMKYL
jgi:hypothetical protein